MRCELQVLLRMTLLPRMKMRQSIGESSSEMELKNLISVGAFSRLEESETGFHLKSVDELIKMAYKYYDDIALLKLVTNFG